MHVSLPFLSSPKPKLGDSLKSFHPPGDDFFLAEELH